MSAVTQRPITPGEYSNRNLQKASFKDEDFSNTHFSGSDLRGASFKGSDLRGADFTNVRTGIPPMIVVWLFVVSLAVSLVSGYIAMLTGRTIQTMLKSGDPYLGAAGMIAIVLSVLFIAYAWWKGGGAA